MKKSPLILLMMAFCLFCSMAKADVVVYKTYTDFQNKKGIHYDEYFGWSHVVDNVTLIFKKDGKKEKIKADSMWGFQDGNSIYRIDHVGPAHIPYLLVSSGKILYYENGIEHLDLPANKTFDGECEVGKAWACSLDMNSDILVYTKANMETLIAGNKNYKTFFDCIGNVTFLSKSKFKKIRACVVQINGK